jgi:hypothetical protein
MLPKKLERFVHNKFIFSFVQFLLVRLGAYPYTPTVRANVRTT